MVDIIYISILKIQGSQIPRMGGADRRTKRPTTGNEEKNGDGKSKTGKKVHKHLKKRSARRGGQNGERSENGEKDGTEKRKQKKKG